MESLLASQKLFHSFELRKQQKRRRRRGQRGFRGNKGTKGEKGDKGDKGNKGDIGQCEISCKNMLENIGNNKLFEVDSVLLKGVKR